jgi:hypothetical protein
MDNLTLRRGQCVARESLQSARTKVGTQSFVLLVRAEYKITGGDLGSTYMGKE